jgi:hypothetical protein
MTILTVLTSILVLGAIYAQAHTDLAQAGRKCKNHYSEATVELHEKNLDHHMKLRGITHGASVADIHITTWVHLITMNDGSRGISDEMVAAQQVVLNNAYNPHGIYFDFDPSRVTRTAKTAWWRCSKRANENKMGEELHQGGADTFNIFFNSGGGYLGYVNFLPSEVTPENNLYDNAIISSETAPGGSANSYNLGDTLVHEAGHWLGLYHTFQGGCKRGHKKGDQIRDTPAEKEASFGCPVNQDSCPGNTGGLVGSDPILNFMDYTDDSCMEEFTSDQATRMRSMWHTFREIIPS